MSLAEVEGYILPGSTRSEIENEKKMDVLHNSIALEIEKEMGQESSKFKESCDSQCNRQPTFSIFDYPHQNSLVWKYEWICFFVRQLLVLVCKIGGCESFVEEKDKDALCVCKRMYISKAFTSKCSSHKQSKECCALDYCIHTLDWVQLAIGNRDVFVNNLLSTGEEEQIKSIVRRVYRIMAHVFFYHPSVFVETERMTGLYRFFVYFFENKVKMLSKNDLTLSNHDVEKVLNSYPWGKKTF